MWSIRCLRALNARDVKDMLCLRNPTSPRTPRLMVASTLGTRQDTHLHGNGRQLQACCK